MKTMWLVIDQGSKTSTKPYSRQYLIFETEREMFKYVVSAGYIGEQSAIMRDSGMMNFQKENGVDLRFSCLEVR